MMKNRFVSVLFVFLLLSSCSGKPKQIELGEVTTISKPVREFLQADDVNRIDEFADGTAEHSLPDPVRLSYKGKQNAEALAEVSLDPSFTESHILNFKGPYFDFYNGLCGKEYFIRLSEKKEKLSQADTYHFTIRNEAPRMIYLDGVTNVRDIGGWIVGEKKIRQGLLYRGSGLNKAYRNGNVSLYLTDAGVSTLTNDLGVTHELDLRMNMDKDGRNEIGGMNDAVFPQIRYTNISWDYRNLNDFLSDTKPEQYQAMFSYLADKKNYPLYLHCSHGTDRTGVLCFLIEALCGLDRKSLKIDYILSAFGNIQGKRTASTIDTYLADLSSYEGTTDQEKAFSFLKEKGVDEKEIQAVKNLFLA